MISAHQHACRQDVSRAAIGQYTAPPKLRLCLAKEDGRYIFGYARTARADYGMDTPEHRTLTMTAKYCGMVVAELSKPAAARRAA